MAALATQPNDPAFEKQYTPIELADLWQVDRTTIVRMFRDEPGVMKVQAAPTLCKKRERVTLRIPASVASRVYKARSR